MRVGVGYDSHRYDPQRPLILGGLEIPGHPGLLGHSDGDAVAHAITDALLGACALGDIGSHFPPDEERWRGADSMTLLASAVERVREAGFQPGNVDVVVVSESIRVGPVADRMRARVADVLDVPRTRVSIKGKSNEGMGWVGRGEGLAVHAVALVVSAP